LCDAQMATFVVEPRILPQGFFNLLETQAP
jgi:hypothetical protein